MQFIYNNPIILLEDIGIFINLRTGINTSITREYCHNLSVLLTDSLIGRQVDQI